MRRNILISIFLLFFIVIVVMFFGAPQLSVYHEVLLNNNPIETSKALPGTMNNLTFMMITNIDAECLISVSSSSEESIMIEPKNTVFTAPKHQKEVITFKLVPMNKTRYIIFYEIDCNSTGFRRSYFSSSGQITIYTNDAKD
ncbi:hypothetical protein PAP_07095 [Palaeococcus pacificus DY20341]|uniref:DUF1616 domain-containing protein n=1 Tax=Palaeococcus pacificus DY20341 TaxID=1343739 RepID=A0A075LTW1_9EURY|nr:hypothetical protein [Palaeococcus pacificus]AIF69809.1 hypothetical protein PAP_07095 [Palaeococcus pacificus DY20341]